MKIASISQAKNQLSALLEAVRQGEVVIITDRNRPVARLEAVLERGIDENDWSALNALERSGAVRRPTAVKSAMQDDVPLPKALGSADILRALLADREEGR